MHPLQVHSNPFINGFILFEIVILPDFSNLRNDIICFCDSMRFDLLVCYNTLIYDANIMTTLEINYVIPQKAE